MRAQYELQQGPLTVPADDVSVDAVDAAGLDSFPASDPPTWSTLRVGSPDEPDNESVPRFVRSGHTVAPESPIT
jgi:hypothetical protein